MGVSPTVSRGPNPEQSELITADFAGSRSATLEWVDWFNNRRLLEPIENIPPAEAAANFYTALETEDIAA